jgi:hypothetical protein
MSMAPRDAMELGLEELKVNANMMSDVLGTILEELQEGNPISEETLRRAARYGRKHEDWIGHTIRRSCFYPKGWKEE